ncbi:MAG: YcaO-like family protein [Actinobacteria bacterium]|nr:YcaO-like family protein [Actinomycetota bacterium]
MSAVTTAVSETGLLLSTIARSLVSPIGGVVSYIRAYDDGTPVAGETNAGLVQIASAGHGPHPEHAPALLGVGAGVDEQAATDDALLRALALYVAALWDSPSMRWASADELGDEGLAVEELARLSPIETRDRIRWVEGFALDDGRPIWLPAVLSHIALPVAVEAENFWPQSVAGLAVANDLGAAVLEGLLECVARDALALARTRNAPIPMLSNDRGVAVFEATTEVGVPCAIAQGPASFEVGLAAAPTLEEARVAAAHDLVRRRTRRACGAYPEEAPPDPDFEPSTGSSMSAPGADAPIDLSKPAIVGRLRHAGLAGYAVDLTTDELRSVALAAVRVIVPGLSPIQPIPGWTDHARLARVAT